MKYIRGKDGIYELSKFGYAYPRNYKKADTIEELCDEFVCLEDHQLLRPCFTRFNDEGYTTQTYHEGILNAFRRGVNYKDFHWIGAIWTDKGLIYVAKMNDKGELELL